ncbi:MAG: hypothetical protein GXO86_05095 [Chlorobi bacterium]|nr:hypothetical protein [Chlorobiota bacterium]
MFRLFSVVFIFGMLISLWSCCGSKPPDPVPAVTVKFEGLKDSDQSRVWVIETQPGQPETKLDSVYYGLLHHVTDYSFVLEFKKNNANGDYHIYADSVKGPNVITNVVINTETDDCGYEVLTFNYRFNGNYYDQRNYEIRVHK